MRAIEKVKEDQTCVNWCCEALWAEIEKKAGRKRRSKGVDIAVYRKGESLGLISIRDFYSKRVDNGEPKVRIFVM